MRRITFLAALAALLASLAGAAGASAAGPESETIAIGPETFYDEFLSEECGVEVWTTVVGSVTLRTFDEASAGVQSVNTVNLSLVALAGDTTFRFRNVGADIVQQTAGGVLTLLIVGQVPFGWTGVLKIDLATDELVMEPHWVDATRACAVLAG